MTTFSVTRRATEYVVEITDGPGNVGDWVGLYLVSTPVENYNSFVSEDHWQFLNGIHWQPETGLTSATLHFPLFDETAPLEFRMWSSSALEASAPVVLPSPTPITPDGYINVKDHGATGDPAGDDTEALNAAANACRDSYNSWGTKGLYFPPGGVYRISSAVDFQYISNIACHGWIVWHGSPATGPCIRVGIPNAAYPGDYFFFGLYNTAETYAEAKYSLLELAGLQFSTVRVGANNGYVSVVATASGGYQGTWKSTFHLGGTQRLELLSDTGDGFTKETGWINSNEFHGGHLAQFRIGSWWRDCTVDGLNVTTSGSHGFNTDDMVEMYNGLITDSSCQTITRVDDTHFTLSSALSANSGTGWRCQGPNGYHHNDNHFYHCDLEDDPAIFVINNASFNHCKGWRTEATGKIVFGPLTYGNTFEASNSTHGRLPDPPDEFEMEKVDHSGGKNFVGWIRLPGDWGT